MGIWFLTMTFIHDSTMLVFFCRKLPSGYGVRAEKGGVGYLRVSAFYTIFEFVICNMYYVIREVQSEGAREKAGGKVP
jgi:hypothetical protein